MSGGVSTVATAIEELNASFSEVSRNTTSAAKIANDASGQASEISQAMNSLLEVSTNIGRVVQIINKIADQTNMLALNAAIEAALSA